MNAPQTGTVFSGLALLVSIGVLIIHYRNQVERRHAEVIQRKAEILSALSNLRQRFVSVLTNGEIVRMELRRLPDTDSKYSWIEKMPKILETSSNIKNLLDERISHFQNMDSAKWNRTSSLLFLQKESADMQALAEQAKEVEDETLAMLKDLQNMNKTPKV